MRGLAAVRRCWRLVLLCYVMSVVVALPAAAGVGAIMHQYFGHRVAGSEVAARWVLPSLVEVMLERPGGLIAVGAAVVAGALAWLLVQTFMSAALLSVSRTKGRVLVRTALSHGGAHFWGLFGLSILGTPFVLAVSGVALWAGRALEDFLNEGTTSEVNALAVRWVTIGIALLIAVWASGTHDVMRVRKVDGAGVLSAFASGLATGLQRPWGLLSRLLPWYLLGLLLTLGLTLLDARLPWTTPAAIAMGVGVQQFLVLTRAFVRLGGLASVQAMASEP